MKKVERAQQTYVIDWRVEGAFECKASSPEEAQEKFDKAWSTRMANDGEVSNSKPVARDGDA